MYLPALPNAATEVEAMAEQLPHTIVLRNQEATLEALSKNLLHAVVFHFAGHAVQTPDGAALIIAASSTRPASTFILDAPALASLKFSQLHLAVLSACSTEAGAEGNGLLDSGSLVRAFMKGGVPEVVGTRWRVESTATEQTMRSFYASLLQGASPADALRLAMNSTRAQERTSHPYYWAAFTSFGWN
jgi:CHAT domain-containing protein